MICSSCKKDKGPLAFARDRSNKNRRRARRCKTCSRVYLKEYYLQNKSEHDIRCRQYYETHKREHAIRGKAWYNKNRHRMTVLAANDRYTGLGVVSVEAWLCILKAFEHRCVYCGSGGPLGMDHVVPKSRGGKHTQSNIVPSCESCNKRKRTKLILEWVWQSPERFVA